MNFRPRIPVIFPLGFVSNNTKTKSCAGFVVYAFQNDSTARVVDLVQYSSAKEETLLYSLARLPKNLKVAAQVLPRQRDNRFRLRLIRDCPVDEDPDPMTLTVGRETDHISLAKMMLSKLRPSESKASTRSTVRIEFIGGYAAGKTMRAIEELYWASRREITFTVSFGSPDAEEDAGSDTGEVPIKEAPSCTA